MKKNILIMLVFILIVSTLSVGALEKSKTETLTDKEIEEVLLSKGVSLDIQKEMSEGMKKDVALDDDIIKLSGVSDEVSTKSIPSGLDVRAYIYTISDINGYDAFKLYNDFIWEDRDPLAYLDDKVGIAWSRDDLTFNNSYLYFTAESGLGETYTYTNSIPDDGASSFTGRGYTVPLNGYYTKNKSGYMWVKVYDTTSHDSEELEIIASYHHKFIGLSGNLSFSSSPSISISPSINYKTALQDFSSIFYSTN